MAKFRTALGGPAILFLATVGIFWKLVLTNQFTWLDNPDFVNQVLPWYQFQASEWHQGRFPLWDPYHWGGQSLIGQVVTGVAYPLNWILYLLPLHDGWIRQSYLHWYFVVIHYMGALFCYFLCRDLKRSRTASILAGAAFGLSGYMGFIDWPQMLNGAVWAPVVFLFLLRAMRGESPLANAALSGAALGFSFLSGHHQIPIFVSLTTGAVWIYYFVLAEIPRRRIVGLACVFGLFLILTGGLQTLPGIEYGKQALRWVNANEPVDWEQKVPYFVHRNYSLGPTSLFGIVIPGVHTGVDPFMGLVVISLAFLAIAAAWRERMVRLFGAIAIGGLIFSLGGNAVFQGVLYAAIPMVEKARSPGMAILIFHLGVAVLAAFGLDALLSQARDWIWTRRLVWALLCLGGVLYTGVLVDTLARPVDAFVHGAPDGAPLAALAALLLAGIVHAWRQDHISHSTAGVLLTTLMLFETGTVTGFFLRHSDLPGYFLTHMKDNSDIARFLGEQPFPIRAEMDREAVPFNWGDWYGIDMFEGYCGVTKNVVTLHADDKFRDLFAIGYYVGAKPRREGQVEIFQGASGLKVYRNAGEHQRVWAVHQVFQIPDEAAIVPALYRPGYDRRRQAFLLGPVPQLETCGGEDDVRMMTHATNRIVIDATLRCRGMVIAGETFSPGWQATVDGKPAEIYEAYSVVRGVVVDAGSHRIEMRFRPKSVIAGAVMTATGLLGALLLWAFARTKNHA